MLALQGYQLRCAAAQFASSLGLGDLCAFIFLFGLALCHGIFGAQLVALGEYFGGGQRQLQFKPPAGQAHGPAG